MTTPTRKEVLEAQLDLFVETQKNPDRKDNAGPLLHNAFVWDTIARYATEAAKKAWAAAQHPREGVLESDDAMRTGPLGETIVYESKAYSCIVTLTKPRETFDQDAFIAAVAKKYRLDRAALEAIAERSKKKGKPSLSKRILAA